MRFILFDAYGTLIDAGKENIVELADEMSKRYKYDSKTIYNLWSTAYFTLENQFDRTFLTIIQANRMSLAYAFGKLELPVTDVEHWIAKLEYKWSHPNPCKGASDFLNRIQLNYPDAKTGIVSNTDEETINNAIKHLQWSFDAVISSEGALSYKPNTGIFAHAIKVLNIDLQRDSCIYIGNSPCDVIASLDSGIPCVLISSTSSNIPDGYQPIKRIDSIARLSDDLLEELLC